MVYELSSSAEEKLEKLKHLFWDVYDHNGDDELISNVNDDYNFDQDEFFRTDGSVNFSVHLANKDTAEPYVTYSTCIRGASYIIVARKFEHNVWLHSLYVNRLSIEEKYDEIVRQHDEMQRIKDAQNCYMDEWRCGDIIKNSMSLDDINCL